MLRTIMKIKFNKKTEGLTKDWLGYDATIIFRPPFNLGGELFSGQIKRLNNEKMYIFENEYTVRVDFFTIDTRKLYNELQSKLKIGQIYDIHCGSRIIGKAQLLDYTFATD